ncbi:MlaD family protein [Gordonia shandongensis]|uniref:MlaD family protein n=1 Tax=Gordonia shandongensis TaxID=376351 RepID=UPI0003FB8E1A|nr:MlaD family protein [Gordonia shandongensis]
MTKSARSRLRRLLGSDLRVGVAVIIVAALVASVITYIYLRPPNQQTVAFETTDAAAISTGDDVRVAGVSVGSVTETALEADRVRVTAEIDDHVFVGDDSRVEIRMLTAVGGYFVTVIPDGDDALGDAVIPSKRVTTPYSIADVLQEAPRITGDVDPKTIDADLRQLATGLTDNTTSFGAMVKGLTSISSVMDRQRDQVLQTLDLAREYTERFEADREFVFRLVAKIERVLTRYNATWEGFNETYTLLGEVLERISPLSWYYHNNKGRLKELITTIRTGVGTMHRQMSPVIDTLGALADRLRGFVGADGMKELGANVVLASDICVPVPGKAC